MRKRKLGFNYVCVCVCPLEEGLRVRGHLWLDKRRLSPTQKVMCLGVGAGKERLITIGSRLASNNDGSARAHPDTVTLIPQWERDHDGQHQRGRGV